jgi:group I intron endonuclease
MSGVVYQIICQSTNMAYIGQATQFKYKQGKPYNYGASGRWNDHVASSKSRETPLCQAIKKYGRDDFKVEVLEEGPLDTLDEREAQYISERNTTYPNGYNVASHSRNRHRETSNLHVFYEGKVRSAIISPIRKNGELKLAHVYLTRNDDTQERLTFGQKGDCTYEDTIQEVTQFLEQLQCPYTTSTASSTVLSEKYASKLEEFKGKEITSVRITSASNLIAVYIGTSEMKLSKEHKRICFGGKTVSKEDAYEIAKQFVTELNISENMLHDSIQCRQQVTA